MNAFFDFIKNSLHFDVTMTQLKDKISRLRKKFENHMKGKKRRKQETRGFEDWVGYGCGEEERMDVEMERDSSVKKVLKFDRNASVGTMDDYVVRSGLDLAHGMKRKRWRRSGGSCI
ncbi:STOREKEEPER PROTEIN [Salix koriyanagi]|nr:STOREKEEPER PROTEIN [Salix koriyanagi]